MERTCSSATQMSASADAPVGSIFSRTVPSKRSGLWGTIEMPERTIGLFSCQRSRRTGTSGNVRLWSPTLVMSRPSIWIVPSAGSMMRKRARRSWGGS